MTTARDIMHAGAECVGESQTLQRAARQMRDLDIGALVICGEDGRLLGIVTDRDIVVRAIAVGKDPKKTRISEVMSADPITVSADDDVEAAERIMRERQVRRLPVVEDGKLVGILVTAQLARNESEREMGEMIKEISEPATGRGSHARG